MKRNRIIFYVLGGFVILFLLYKNKILNFFKNEKNLNGTKPETNGNTGTGGGGGGNSETGSSNQNSINTGSKTVLVLKGDGFEKEPEDGDEWNLWGSDAENFHKNHIVTIPKAFKNKYKGEWSFVDVKGDLANKGSRLLKVYIDDITGFGYTEVQLKELIYNAPGKKRYLIKKIISGGVEKPSVVVSEF